MQRELRVFSIYADIDAFRSCDVYFAKEAQDSYVESQETCSSLFEDLGKLNAIMNTLADVMVHEMRRSKSAEQ